MDVVFNKILFFLYTCLIYLLLMSSREFDFISLLVWYTPVLTVDDFYKVWFDMYTCMIYLMLMTSFKVWLDLYTCLIYLLLLTSIRFALICLLAWYTYCWWLLEGLMWSVYLLDILIAYCFYKLCFDLYICLLLLFDLLTADDFYLMVTSTLQLIEARVKTTTSVNIPILRVARKGVGVMKVTWKKCIKY